MSLIKLEKERNLEIENKNCILEFGATWCGYCKMIKPVIAEVINEITMDFIEIDIDEHEQIAMQFGIMTVPTLVLVKDGKEIKRSSGYMNKEEVMDFIK